MLSKIKNALNALDARLPNESRLVVGRNESFRDSMRLGWGVNLLWAPSSLLRALKISVPTFLLSGLAVALCFCSWLLTVLIFMGLAPFGMVSLDDDETGGGSDARAA